MADNDDHYHDHSNHNNNQRDRNHRGVTGGFPQATPAEPPAGVPRSTTSTGQDKPTGQGKPPAASPEPDTEPSWAPSDGNPTQPVAVAARFSSASAALVFAGSVAGIGGAQNLLYSRGDPAAPGGWWVSAELPLDLGRELADTALGQLFVHVDGLLLADRGWGGPPAPPPASPPPHPTWSDSNLTWRNNRSAATQPDLVDPSLLRAVGIIDVVRAAGLHPACHQAAGHAEAVVLLPGIAATAVVRRALDLGLTVHYRPVRVTPLFEAHTPAAPRSGGHGAAGDGTTDHDTTDHDTAGHDTTSNDTAGHDTPGHGSTDHGGGPFGTGHVATELRLATAEGSLPYPLLDALEQDPFALVCRAAGDGLLVQLRAGTTLPDALLADLVDHGTWVLADPAFGCWRLTGLAEPADATALVCLGPGYRLDPAPGHEPGFTASGVPATEDATPAPRPVAVVIGRTPAVGNDAVLLHDDDLASLPALLEIHPLADIAHLVRGRDKHLLLAGGGLLERLPVGEPLYCLGPGALYLPVGYRMSPRLPATARRALFGADAATAVVALAEHAFAFDLTTRVPVWTLWAGPAPAIDVQLPASTMEALADVEYQDQYQDQGTPVGVQPTAAAAPEGRARRLVNRLRARSAEYPDGGPVDPDDLVDPVDPVDPALRTWRDEALELELAGDLERAGELHESNGDLLRAARLFERAAHPDGRGDG